MTTKLDQLLLNYSDDELKEIKRATPIRMKATVTIEGNNSFDEAVNKLRKYDKQIKKAQDKRSMFNTHKTFISHILCFLMDAKRKSYFSVPTGNKAGYVKEGVKYTYKAVAYTIDLLEDIGWIKRVPQEIANFSTAGKEPQPWARIEVLDTTPLLNGDYKLVRLTQEEGYVDLTNVTSDDKKDAYPKGTYTEADQQQDETLLVSYNQLMADTVIRDDNNQQLSWMYPLKRVLKVKDYVKQNGKRIKGVSGGRFFGPEFLSMKEADRVSHTFNGEPLVEVDIHRCFPQFAFHMNNIPVPDLDDLYSIPKEIADSPDVACKIPKSIFMVAFNVNSKGAWKTLLNRDYGITPALAELLLPRFDLIKDLLFQRSIGHELMWIESQIVKYVLEKAVEYSVPVIPVHDSYLVVKDKEAWLKGCINNAYHSQFREPSRLERIKVGDNEYFHYEVQTTSTFG